MNYGALSIVNFRVIFNQVTTCVPDGRFYEA